MVIAVGMFAISFILIAMVNAEHHAPEFEVNDFDPHMLEEKKPYHFGYEIHEEDGKKQHRHEESDGNGTVKGSYGYIDNVGVHRIVEYIADGHGFRAKVLTNEPGTESDSPADTEVISSYSGVSFSSSDHAHRESDEKPNEHEYSRPIDEEDDHE